MKYDSVFYGAHTDTMYKGLLVHMDDQSTVIQVRRVVYVCVHNYSTLLMFLLKISL